MWLHLLIHRLSSDHAGGSIWRRNVGVEGSSRQPGRNLHPRTNQLSRCGGGCSSSVELRLSCGLLGLLLRLLDLLLLLHGCTGLEDLHLELLLLTQRGDGDVLSGCHLSGHRLRHHARLLLLLLLGVWRHLTRLRLSLDRLLHHVLDGLGLGLGLGLSLSLSLSLGLCLSLGLSLGLSLSLSLSLGLSLMLQLQLHHLLLLNPRLMHLVVLLLVLGRLLLVLVLLLQLLVLMLLLLHLLLRPQLLLHLELLLNGSILLLLHGVLLLLHLRLLELLELQRVLLDLRLLHHLLHGHLAWTSYWTPESFLMDVSEVYDESRHQR